MNQHPTLSAVVVLRYRTPVLERPQALISLRQLEDAKSPFFFFKTDVTFCQLFSSSEKITSCLSLLKRHQLCVIGLSIFELAISIFQ